MVSYDDAVGLVAVMAGEAQVHRCYVTHLLNYLEGRTITSADNDRIDALTAASLEGRPILDLIRDVVTDPAFRGIGASPLA